MIYGEKFIIENNQPDKNSKEYKLSMEFRSYYNKYLADCNEAFSNANKYIKNKEYSLAEYNLNDAIRLSESIMNKLNSFQSQGLNYKVDFYKSTINEKMNRAKKILEKIP